jgi:hypothetical protein
MLPSPQAGDVRFMEIKSGDSKALDRGTAPALELCAERD